jgi:hypothetical protein
MLPGTGRESVPLACRRLLQEHDATDT